MFNILVTGVTKDIGHIVIQSEFWPILLFHSALKGYDLKDHKIENFKPYKVWLQYTMTVI